MFKKIETYVPLNTLVNYSNSLLDSEKNPRRLAIEYMDKLEDNGIGYEQITVLYPNLIVDYKYSSALWVEALNQLFNDAPDDPPEGIFAKNSNWMVPVTIIRECGNCKHPLGRLCHCAQEDSKHANL